MCLSAYAYRNKQHFPHSLNPCYVGCASRLLNYLFRWFFFSVLILVMLDVPLGSVFWKELLLILKPVLILVMLDVPLG